MAFFQFKNRDFGGVCTSGQLFWAVQNRGFSTLRASGGNGNFFSLKTKISTWLVYQVKYFDRSEIEVFPPCDHLEGMAFFSNLKAEISTGFEHQANYYGQSKINVFSLRAS